MTNRLTLPLALVVAAALSASPALAQHGNGHGHGNGGGNGRGHDTEHVRSRDDRDDDDDRVDDRRDVRRDDQRVSQERRSVRRSSSRSSNGTLRRRVPPGWCIGRGNPHNTVENCGYGNNRYDRRYDPRYNGTYGSTYGGRTTDRYGRTIDPRTGRVYDSRTGTYGNYGGSSRDAFNQWKRQHDAQCRNLARQRPLDLRWQAQVRTQCSAGECDSWCYYGFARWPDWLTPVPPPTVGVGAGPLCRDGETKEP